MNYDSNRSVETTLDLKDFLLKLIGQWKAALIITLIMGLLLSGALQAFRVQRYKKASASAQKTAEETTLEPANAGDMSKKEKILSTLSATDRVKVEGAIWQANMIKDLDNYMNNSIVMNTDPANVDTINLQYYIKRDVGSLQGYTNAIVQGYKYYVNSDDFISEIKTDLELDQEDVYLRECFSVNETYDHDGDYGLFICLKIIKPEGVELEKLEPVVTSSLKNFSVTLSSDVVQHYINLSYSEECYEANNSLMKDKYNFTNTVANAKNSMASTVAGFNDSQRSAYEAILDESVDAGDSYVDQKTTAAKPRYSSKLFIIGWFGAIVLYVFFYALYVLLRKRINSSDTLGSSYGVRVFGDVYYTDEKSGLKKLFRSNFVNKLYHKGALDRMDQISKITSSVDAAVECKNAGDLTILLAAKENGTISSIANMIAETVKATGKNVSIVDVVSGVLNEKIFAEIGSAVLIADSDSKVDDVNKVVDLCGYYNTDLLGAVYTEAI